MQHEPRFEDLTFSVSSFRVPCDFVVVPASAANPLGGLIGTRKLPALELRNLSSFHQPADSARAGLDSNQPRWARSVFAWNLLISE